MITKKNLLLLISLPLNTICMEESHKKTAFFKEATIQMHKEQDLREKYCAVYFLDAILNKTLYIDKDVESFHFFDRNTPPQELFYSYEQARTLFIRLFPHLLEKTNPNPLSSSFSPLIMSYKPKHIIRLLNDLDNEDKYDLQCSRFILELQQAEVKQKNTIEKLVRLLINPRLSSSPENRVIALLLIVMIKQLATPHELLLSFLRFDIQEIEKFLKAEDKFNLGNLGTFETFLQKYILQLKECVKKQEEEKYIGPKEDKKTKFSITSIENCHIS